MKVFTVTGLTGSGKTSTIEAIIKELKKRGYTVGSLKEIHFEAFKIDTEGKNTYRHRMAGATTVTALSTNETDVMYQGAMNIYDILKHYKEDFVVLEGVSNAVVPHIAVCKENEKPNVSELTFAVSGRFANNSVKDFKGLPVFHIEKNIEEFVDYILEKVPNLFYDIDVACCGKCGTSCRGLLREILKGNKYEKDCVMKDKKLTLKIDNKEIIIVPFVQTILKNSILGIIQELNGFNSDKDVEITFKS